MPRTGMLWRHVIINTLGTWLHGDERGFRSRDHRIHSSGDYKHRPPQGEHFGLHEHHELRSSDEVVISKPLRLLIGVAMIEYLLSVDYRVLALAVARVHAHAIVELPDDRKTVKRVAGEMKRRSSRAVKAELPGRVWAAGGTFKMIETRKHLASATNYVLFDQGPTAWTWSCRDGDDRGRFGRQRSSR